MSSAKERAITEAAVERLVEKHRGEAPTFPRAANQAEAALKCAEQHAKSAANRGWGRDNPADAEMKWTELFSSDDDGRAR